MGAQVLSLWRRTRSHDWTQQELAEFYRVESILSQAGISVETDRGVTDEGEPWFVFCRADTGEVMIHFARIDNRYMVGGSAFGGTAVGADFRSLVQDLLSRHPLVCRPKEEGSNVLLHPTALLVALVATAFLDAGDAEAHATTVDGSNGSGRRASEGGGATAVSSILAVGSIILEPKYVAVALSAVILAGSFAVEQAASLKLAMLAPEHDETLEGARLSQVFAPSSDYQLGEIAEIHSGLRADDPTQDLASGPNFLPLTTNDLLSALSLLAILKDLTQRSEDSPSEPTAGASSQFAHDPVAGSGFVDAPAILVNLISTGGALPAIRKLDLSNEYSSESESESESAVDVIEVLSALPSILQPYLAEGIHLTVQGVSATEVLMVLDLGDIKLQNLLSAEGQTVPPKTLYPAETPEVLSAIGLPLAVMPEVTAARTGPADTYADTIEAAVQNFLAHTPAYKIILVDDDIIFYDVPAVQDGAVSLRTVTWEFSDGASISLVGLASNLPHDLIG